MRAGITAYNKATNTPESLDRGYHETITLAFMRLVFATARCSEPCRSSEIFCDRHPELMSKLALRRHYSTGRLMTMTAKTSFVTPDLAPLPLVLDDSTIIWNITEGRLLRTSMPNWLDCPEVTHLRQDADAGIRGQESSRMRGATKHGQ